MGVTNSNKTIDATSINCGGTFKVTLALAAAPDIVNNPTDIVLILDRSGSMAGSPLANLKLGAKKFIDIIDEATDSSQDGNIGSGSRIGIVSFAGTATQNTQLITSVDTLKAAVDSLTAGGNTNHADAFEQATAMFDPASSNARVMVMFTDGKTTAGPDPNPIAAAARAQGIIIYCIGLIGSDGIDPDVLDEWATDPNASHVAITPDDADLEELFEDLAENISKPGATNITIEETLKDDFHITSIQSPTKGTAVMLNDTTLRWSIDELGVNGNEGATLEFLAQHVSQNYGLMEVNASIDYSDSEGNVVTFPSPKITVDCDIIVREDCPTPQDFSAESCEGVLEYDAGDVSLESIGRIVQIDARLKNVCPAKRVALAVHLTEVDDEGQEYQRGLKTLLVPAHDRQTCQDVMVRCIKFVLPEELNVSGEEEGEMCATRNFRVRLFANYVDSNYDCCGELTAEP